MYYLYIVAPDYSLLLSQIFDEFRNSDNERLFRTMGFTDNIYTLAKAVDIKSGFNSNVVIIIKSELTESEHELILHLSARFSAKSFFVILPDSFTKGKDVIHTIENLKFITSLKFSQPELMNNLIQEIISHLDTTQISSTSISTKKFTKVKKIKMQNGKNLKFNSGVISVLGVSHGIGVTHTCILLANCFKDNKKVAVIELNDHKHFKEMFHHKINRDEIQKAVYNNVHYFWNTNLVQFWTHFRQEYDYVIIDMGAFEDLYDLDEFLRADIKIVITHGSDWKMKELFEFYSSTLKYDPKNQWIYGVPFLDKKYLKEMHKSIENKIFNIPFQMDPFRPSKDVCEVLEKILV